MSYRRSFVFLVVAGIGAGCGDDTGVALEAAPAAFASAYCERALACCETSELEAMLGAVNADRASCEAFIARVFGNEFIDDTQRAIQLGSARYDPSAMRACVEHLRADDCVHLTRPLRLMTFPSECPTVRSGRVSIGGECDHDFHCINRACASGADHEAGRCEEVPALGAPCPTGDCGDGAYCDRSGTIAVCASVNADGGSCTSALGCESLQCTSGICAPPISCDGV